MVNLVGHVPNTKTTTPYSSHPMTLNLYKPTSHTPDYTSDNEPFQRLISLYPGKHPPCSNATPPSSLHPPSPLQHPSPPPDDIHHLLHPPPGPTLPNLQTTSISHPLLPTSLARRPLAIHHFQKAHRIDHRRRSVRTHGRHTIRTCREQCSRDVLRHWVSGTFDGEVTG